MRMTIGWCVILLVALAGCDGGAGESTATAAPTSTAAPSTTAPSTPTTTTTVAPTTTNPIATTLPTTTTSTGPTGAIAYNHRGELWLIDADGSNDRPLVTSVVVESGAAWSPDGSMLAFSGFESGSAVVVPNIWRVRSDGTGLTRLTNSDAESQLSPSWSPDGSRIVFASTDRDLWLIAAGGGEPTRLTTGAAHQSNPAWSPDGSLIAYCNLPVLDKQLGANDVWVIAPDGSGARRLTDFGGACLPAWSPDARSIAFTVFVQPAGADDYADLWVMARDGTGQRNLTNDPARFDRAPTWSPDGTLLAFDSAGPIRPYEDPDVGLVIDHDPPAQVYVMATAGGARARLTTGDGPSGAPAWGP